MKRLDYKGYAIKIVKSGVVAPGYYVRELKSVGNFCLGRFDTMDEAKAHVDSLTLVPTPETTSGPKFPQVTVQLTGSDGNAFAILGLVSQAMRRAGVSREDISAFTAEATTGNYDHLLQTVLKTVNVR